MATLSSSSGARRVPHPYTPSEIDQNTTLCLACSCSLPPVRVRSPLTSSSPGAGLWTPTTFTPTDSSGGIYITPCCHRPICLSCIASNPRLKRYDPCLRCLGGVDVVGYRSSGEGEGVQNIDGRVRDADTFVVGDDDDEERGTAPPPPSYVSDVEFDGGEESNLSIDSELPTSKPEQTLEEENQESPSETGNTSGPRKYYLKKNDTLQGIALRFGIDGREVCRLNGLPPSVLSTTPHLLHTRGYIRLPPGVDVRDVVIDEQREKKRVRERAERKLQTLMKEVDWRVAKAYVAVADDAGEEEEMRRKRKESGIDVGGGGLEMSAIDRYLDDEEWEASERKAGRSPALGIPLAVQGKL